MTSLAIWFGRVLVILGILGYGYGLTEGNASFTALIPSAFGLVLMVLGYLGQRYEGARMHFMHVAVLIGLVGFIVPAWRLISKFNGFAPSAAFFSQLFMALICLVFVLFSIRSFVNARRG
ncbi:MAG: hypothetical protein UZ17_ACD001000755 [Acidobacteria bacterium OLB17]|nr:MAG: hypothetical protein UZ17_ACD001000755 [Acidobacteria bacterium OLB17]MCZ2389687.1 hypothetical protein [Acidobacteriota bacterium]